ncbi:FAD binding domain-containing protein [Colletotrichum salicis]|uniref:FAD binding domain-containing protein n=1 Tax=Colletotrichum salicis TaxID=1209931 RepID=A0A135UKJ1_9PEZI|nr:FAD binding domain-containing protein [Colletotrichum salicis]
MALKRCLGAIALLRLSSQVVAQSNTTSSGFKAGLGSVSSAGNWDVAVRSGGHSNYDNNAAHRGVTIDLTFFNSTKLVKSHCFNGTADWEGQSVLTKSIAQICPAARWGNVMTYLEKYNLGVTGGRSGHVGAGGLLVSGGASYHTQLYGFSCDNVVGYELVLADGLIVEADTEENADLFKALKGGGSNLGIVTRFDLRTFTVPPTSAYGGLIFASLSDLDVVINQFVSYASSIGSGNPDREFVVYRSDAGNLAVMAMAVSTGGNENSTTFPPFNDITLTRDMRSKQPLSKVAATIADTGGSHYIPFSLSLQATPEIMKKAADMFVALTQEMNATSVPVSVNFVFQPLPKNLASVKPGNNILGFDKNLPADSILFEARGSLEATDVEYGGFVESTMGHSTFLYMNYANPEQGVIGSYGAESVRLLKDTAAKYDPAGFFQRRIPGGWKVSQV